MWLVYYFVFTWSKQKVTCIFFKKKSDMYISISSLINQPFIHSQLSFYTTLYKIKRTNPTDPTYFVIPTTNAFHLEDQIGVTRQVK